MPLPIETIVSGLYPESGAHNKTHTLEVFRLTQEIGKEPEYQITIGEREEELVGLAALFHDVGYPEKKEYWEGTQWEHPYASVEIFQKYQDLGLSPIEKAIVGFLILNHDNTGFTFPAYRRLELERDGYTDPIGYPSLKPDMLVEGFGFGNYLEQIPAQKFFSMLQILREADSRLGNNQRTIEFSKSRGIPISSDDGGLAGVGFPMWQHSGLANVLLAANRALLDAYTASGRQKAWQMFEQTRQFIKNTLQEANSHFGEPIDNVGDLLRYEDVKNLIWQPQPKSLTRIIQAFPLEGVPLILGGQYGNTRPASRLVNIANIKNDIGVPNTSLVGSLSVMRNALIQNYALDILTETSGALRVVLDGDCNCWEYTLIPPILRASTDTRAQSSSYTLISGNNWLNLAEEVGLTKIRALVIA